MSENKTVNVLSGFGGDVGMEPIDTVWLILCTFIILTMQTGFGLFESGISIKTNPDI